MEWVGIFQQMIDTGEKELEILDQFSRQLSDLEAIVQGVDVMTPQLQESIANMLAGLRTTMIAQLKRTIEAQTGIFKVSIRKTAEMN